MKEQKKRPGCIFIIIIFLCSFPSLFADIPGDDFGDPFGQDEVTEDSADTEDVAVEETDDSKETTGTGESGLTGVWKPEISITGDLHYTPLLRISPDNDISFVLNKMTGNTHITYSFGDCGITGSFKAELDPDQYEDLYKLSISELFFSYHMDLFDFRAGYSSIDWSLMNVFKLTNYFHTPVSLSFDLDLFPLPPDIIASALDYSTFTVDEEITDPVTGIRLLLFYGIFSLELAASPPFFYNDLSFDIGNILAAGVPDQVSLALSDTPPEAVLTNGEIAARLGMTFNAVDLYFSYFHGFDRRQFFTTTTTVEPPANLDIEIEREYSIVDKTGLSVSADILGLIVNAEAVFSFSDPVLYYKTAVYPDPLGGITDVKRKRTTSLEISAGCDWEIIPNLRLITEYNDYFLLEDIPGVMEEILPGDTLFGAIRYTLALPKMELTCMPGIQYDFSGNELTSVNKMEFDFLNGFSVELNLFYFFIPEETSATADSFKLLNEDFLAGIFFHMTF